MTTEPTAPRSRQARQTALRSFADSTRRLMEANGTTFGRSICAHIGRQLDLLMSPAYTAWFRGLGNRAGFDQAVTLAAIAGSDVTRPSRSCAAARANFGLTADRVAALAAQGDLRYGQVFARFSGIEDLYMHAEAGRHYTLTELTRRAQACPDPRVCEQAARHASEAIIGHDSFNAGFGTRRLKPLLAAKYGEPPGRFDYPASCCGNGFLVQILDRREGLEPETLLRYVREAVSDRRDKVSSALRVGIIDNVAFIQEAYEQILLDARAHLSAAAFAAVQQFPGLREIDDHLQRMQRILALLGTPPQVRADGFYHLAWNGRDIALNSLDAIEAELLPAIRALG